MPKAKKISDIVLEQSLRIGRMADMLELLHDKLVDDMPEHLKAEQIRALAFAACDMARAADKGILKVSEMLFERSLHHS